MQQCNFVYIYIYAIDRCGSCLKLLVPGITIFADKNNFRGLHRGSFAALFSHSFTSQLLFLRQMLCILRALPANTHGSSLLLPFSKPPLHKTFVRRKTTFSTSIAKLLRRATLRKKAHPLQFSMQAPFGRFPCDLGMCQNRRTAKLGCSPLVSIDQPFQGTEKTNSPTYACSAFRAKCDRHLSREAQPWQYQKHLDRSDRLTDASGVLGGIPWGDPLSCGFEGETNRNHSLPECTGQNK